MRKTSVLFFPFLLVACTKKQSWQGTFCPEGCLTCDSKHIYSPVFKSYNECKSWAETKMKNGYDRASFGRGCEYEVKIEL